MLNEKLAAAAPGQGSATASSATGAATATTKSLKQEQQQQHLANNSTHKSSKSNLQRGLSTKVALARLHEEIFNVLQEYERRYNEEDYFRKLRSAFVKRYESPLGWLSIVTTLLTTLALFCASMYLPAICLLLILSLDLCYVVRENHLRRTEIFRKTKHVLHELTLAEEQLCDDWQPCNYPHLCSPMSPCVSLQWTYRDGIIVNLPWALLVRGDYIVLRPGHIAPGPCQELHTKRYFNAHEIYGASQMSDPPVKPVARAPLQDLVCCLESTPYLDNLRTCLESSLKRPPTIYNQQRYLLVTKYIQEWGFIIALLISICAGLLRFNGYGLPTDEKHNWRFVLIESPAATVIPLLPLIFPIMWISMNLWGIARLQCFLKTPQTVLAKTTAKSFEEDLDTPSFDYENISLKRSNVLRTWTQLWRGDSEFLPRSANVVQVLGSVTALCCVDKKGILSWPNPTAEKVFFLHNTNDEQNEDGRCSSQMSMQTESDDMPDVMEDNKQRGIVAEVLDLTHDQHCPFRLEFDDHEWKAHIKSLKPLGLAILLNTCSPLTHAHYAQFCGHVTAVAMLDKDLVPVTNRYEILDSSMKSFLHGRCLCELAKQIGFTDHATDRFALEGQLASYRHLQPDVVRRDIRFARQLQLSSKVKVPFPHSLSVVMRENPGGYLSLFTQGTADIILDCCDDFWDGKDLRPLAPQDRKRALDFYQRSALTAYCTAFSYRPLRHGINGALSGAQHSGGPIAYLELPPESKLRMQHVDKMHCDFESSHHAKLSHSISTDSLLFSESKEEDISDVESCFEMQCHQVFIGMVTMQYQAQTDIVQLVERLERACIRFVHFSKENELRSRVFSEKMGLESGWNCHISLLSESEEAKQSNHVSSTVKSTVKTTDNAGNLVKSSENTSNTNTNTTNNKNKNTSNITNAISINVTELQAHDNHSNHNKNNNNNSTNTYRIPRTTTTTTTTATTTTSASDKSSSQLHNDNHQSSSKVMYIFPHAKDDVDDDEQPKQMTNIIKQQQQQQHCTDDADDDHDTFVGVGAGVDGGDGVVIDDEKSTLKYLLGPPTNLESSKTLSSSAPGAISNPDECKALNLVGGSSGDEADSNNKGDDEVITSARGSQLSLEHKQSASEAKHAESTNAAATLDSKQQRHSLDSAMDENCRSLSTLTESTEQSAPVNFDMSNRAKLPRGIENIRPHLEQVDNVPLQVSLFTDCSAEATCQMLDIMQSYGEIVVCLGSSASNSNAEIFQQADCSIAVEPLYPQVCQDVDSYTEANIHNNKLRLLRAQQAHSQQRTTSENIQNKKQQQHQQQQNETEDAYTSEELLESGMYGYNARPMQTPANTISPIYLSRLLNSLPCSISICRDDPLSLVAIIELSRRFSSGLWNSIQFWACCAGTISVVNLLSACLSLPPILTPLMGIYLMSIPVPLIALALAHIDIDPKIMNRATGKKQTEYDTRVFGFVVWCYGCKFLVPVLSTIISYCVFMAHPRIAHIISNDNAAVDDLSGIDDADDVSNEDDDDPEFHEILEIARTFSFLGILLHFAIVSASFVHRDHSLWQRNPFRNRIWTLTCFIILLLHVVLCTVQIVCNENIYELLSNIWPAIVVLYSGSLISLIVSELTKMHEIKVNSRYQRRARLDFGTKLGMNSPF